MNQPAARYREFAPCEALREHVSAFFSCTAPAEIRLPERPVTREVLVREFCPAVFADGHVSIVVGFGSEYREDGFWHPSSARPCGEVIGAMTAVRPASDGPRREMVGVYFRGGRASQFTHVPTCEFTDRVVTLTDVWGEASSEISKGNSEAACIDRLESALVRQLSEARSPDTTVDVAGLADYAVRRRGRLTVEWLADAAGVSRQRLARVFRESVGVSPKLYCRLARFRAALVHARAGGDWAQVAVEMGYTDQSHMIAEFREFSSVTPGALATRRFFHPFLGRARLRATRIS